jgi:hypothetical protein
VLVTGEHAGAPTWSSSQAPAPAIALRKPASPEAMMTLSNVPLAIGAPPADGRSEHHGHGSARAGPKGYERCRGQPEQGDEQGRCPRQEARLGRAGTRRRHRHGPLA